MTIPVTAEGLTPAVLTEVIGEAHPGASVVGVEVVEQRGDDNGVGVSTSALVRLQLEYGPGTPDHLPRAVAAKMMVNNPDPYYKSRYRLFATEVDFYTKIRPELDIEAPMSLGGRLDPEAVTYLLLMEDVSVRGAHFSSIKEDGTVASVQGVMDSHARLHAHFWNSPRFAGDLAWVENQIDSPLEREFFQDRFRSTYRRHLEDYKFKRELVALGGADEERLFNAMAKVKRHHATLPQTYLHGDSHVGNTYLLPNGVGGLYDWQVCVRGYGLHDVVYHMITALSVEDRRKHDRELLAFYRDRLIAYGVADAPDMETVWLEARRAAIWGYYAWMPTNIRAYGIEPLMVVLLRLSAAFQDYETLKAIDTLG